MNEMWQMAMSCCVTLHPKFCVYLVYRHWCTRSANCKQRLLHDTLSI